jgi:predicted Rdx family selenoprotein
MARETRFGLINLPLGDFMKEKTIAALGALVFAGAVSAGAQTTLAHQTRWCRNQDGTQSECRDLRRDTREIRSDRRDLGVDKREIRQDVRQGEYGEARGELRDLHRDQVDLGHDRRDRRHDVRDIRKG